MEFDIAGDLLTNAIGKIVNADNAVGLRLEVGGLRLEV